MADAVEIYIRPRQGDDEVAPIFTNEGSFTGFDVLDRASKGLGPCGFNDGARGFEHVFDGGADLVIAHRDMIVHNLLANGKGELAKSADRRAVGKTVNMIEANGLSCLQRLTQSLRACGFDGDDFGVGGVAVKPRANAGD